MDKMSAFASLNRYFVLTKKTKPTLAQAQEAVKTLCVVYGAESEAQILNSGDDDLIKCFQETKTAILGCVN